MQQGQRRGLHECEGCVWGGMVDNYMYMGLVFCHVVNSEMSTVIRTSGMSGGRGG
jgi:hypothetical protein